MLKIGTIKYLKNIFGSAGSKSKVSTKVSAEYGHKHGYQNEEHLHSKGYQCPMKCEGDKVYDSSVNCPVCNMKLVHVGDKKSNGNHDHGCC